MLDGLNRHVHAFGCIRKLRDPFLGAFSNYALGSVFWFRAQKGLETRTWVLMPGRHDTMVILVELATRILSSNAMNQEIHVCFLPSTLVIPKS